MKPSLKTEDKPLLIYSGEVELKTPPFSEDARKEAGYLLRKLQRGNPVFMPYSRPMPSIGRRCHELRIQDKDGIWRIVYRVDSDAIWILEIFQKKTQKTPQSVINNCKRRIRDIDSTKYAKN